MPHGDIETFHVDGEWKNRVEGTDEVSEPFRTKEEATAAGRAEAQKRKVEHIIRNLDGQIHERNTYGHDPRDVKG